MTASIMSQKDLQFQDLKKSNEIKYNLNTASNFLSYLAEGENVTFQTFDDTNCKNRDLAKIFHGSLDEHVEALIKFSQQGAGVFFTVNQTDGKGRKTPNIIKVRAVFIDLDGAPLEPVKTAPILPHLIIESSPGRFHAYWLIEGLELQNFSILQQTLAERFDSDPKVKDLPRVMRLPGFVHQKGQPFLTRIIEERREPPIVAESFFRSFSIDLGSPKKKGFTSADPVLKALNDAGILKSKDNTNQGRWHVKCPWHHLHSTADNEAHYYEPHTNGYAGHGFKCFHSHCIERKGEDLLNWLGHTIKGTRKDEAWEEPVPLPEGLPSVALLEPDMLPDALRSWIMDIAERMQIPPDFSAASAIVILSALIGRKIGILPKQKDDWLVVPNLWGAVVGRPSLLKSPAIAQVMKPLDNLVAKALNKHDEDKSNYILKEMAAKAKKEALQKKINKMAEKENSDLKGFLEDQKIETHAEPVLQRYKTEDGTVEKIGEILVQNQNGILIHRDELTGWLKSLDKEGREGDRAFYLEAWNGSGSFTVDRIKRGTLHIPALCLSILGGIQPGPLSSYIYQAMKGGAGDDGLIQRFQLIVWPDAPKEWKNVDRFPDTQAKERAYKIFYKLNEYVHHLSPEDLGTEIPAVHFSPDAQKEFDIWRERHEKRLLSGELCPSMESHLAKYRSLMPSLSLIFQLCQDLDMERETQYVECEAAKMAIRWCDYLESHAQRLYSSLEYSGVDSAKALMQRTEKGDILDGFTLRDVYLKHWSKLATPEEVQRAVDLLVLHGWLAVDEVKTLGRSKHVIKIHPLLKTIKRDNY